MIFNIDFKGLEIRKLLIQKASSSRPDNLLKASTSQGSFSLFNDYLKICLQTLIRMET